MHTLHTSSYPLASFNFFVTPILFFYFVVNEIWTQGLRYGRQTLFHWGRPLALKAVLHYRILAREQCQPQELGLPIWINKTVKITPQRHAMSPVSWAIPDLVRLTIDTSCHIFIEFPKLVKDNHIYCYLLYRVE